MQMQVKMRSLNVSTSWCHYPLLFQFERRSNAFLFEEKVELKMDIRPIALIPGLY